MPERSRSRSGGREPRGPDVEGFLRAEPEIEERAAQMLRSKPPEVQRLVIARGGLAGTRNPTAVLVSRIRNAEEGLRPVLDTERAPEEIERFLIIERVEPHAAARLRRASKVVQQAVVTRGSLAGTRDPTAVLMTRIRDAEKEQQPANGEVGATQAATDAAAAAAANPYGSDPQAYAMAYYAQYQQQYPQGVQGYAGYAGYPAAALYPGMAAAYAQQATQGAEGQTQVVSSTPQLPAGYSQVAAAYPWLPGYQLPVGYPQMPTAYQLPAGYPGYALAAPGSGPAGAIPICDGAGGAPGDPAQKAGADGQAPLPIGDSQPVPAMTQVPATYPQMPAYPQIPAGYSMPAGYLAMAPGYPQMSAGQLAYSQVPGAYQTAPAAAPAAVCAAPPGLPLACGGMGDLAQQKLGVDGQAPVGDMQPAPSLQQAPQRVLPPPPPPPIGSAVPNPYQQLPAPPQMPAAYPPMPAGYPQMAPGYPPMATGRLGYPAAS